MQYAVTKSGPQREGSGNRRIRSCFLAPEPFCSRSDLPHQTRDTKSCCQSVSCRFVSGLRSSVLGRNVLILRKRVWEQSNLDHLDTSRSRPGSEKRRRDPTNPHFSHAEANRGHSVPEGRAPHPALRATLSPQAGRGATGGATGWWPFAPLAGRRWP